MITLLNSDKVVKMSNYSFGLIFFVVIFISDDTFTFGTNESVGYIILKYVIYLLLITYLLGYSNLKSLTYLNTGNLVLCLILLSIFIAMLFNLDFRGGYIYQFVIIFSAFLINNYMPSKNLVKIFTKYIYILSIISLVVFTAASISDRFLTFFPVFTNKIDVEFYNLVVCVVFKDVGAMRNTGIFREPGVYMIYLNIAILFELFYNEKINKSHLIVYLITLFTTFSTAAFIILLVIAMAYLLKANKSGAIYSKALIIGIGVVVIAVIALSPDIYSRVFDKIGKDSINDGSSLARAASVLINYHIFIDNPLAGCGITKYVDDFATYSRELFHITTGTGNNTNMILTVFAVYGLLFGLVLLFAIARLTKKFSKEFIVRGMIFIAFLMMLSNEDVRYSLMIFVLFFWGLKTDFNKEHLQIGNLEEKVEHV
jgi:hypothetical protein